MSLALTLVALGLYAVALLPLARGALNQAQVNQKLVVAFALAGGLVHLLSTLSSVFGANGVDLSLFLIGSLIFSVAVVLVALSCIRHPLHSLLLILIPLAIIPMLTNTVTEPTKVSSLSVGTGVHVLFSVLAYGVISIAAVCALVLYYCNYLLKHKQVGRQLRLLPPMETIDKLLFEMIVAGEILLSLSILSGVLFVEDFLGQQLAHKTFFSLVSWAIFGWLIIGHYRFGWRGAKAIKWTLAGFTALLVAYAGSKFVIEWVLG